MQMIEIFGVEEAKKISSLDEVATAAMKWHFSQETGSEFWLGKRKELGFDPLQDIKKYEDLKLFTDYSEEMKYVDASSLIPKGISKISKDIDIYESGGTTGSPMRIIDSYSRKKALDWVEVHLQDRGIGYELEGNWLHVGPTGPHIVGTSIGRLAKGRGKLCYYIDFDPRWVKGAAKKGQIDMVKNYVEHILEQVKAVLKTQNISVMLITPLVLEALSKNSALCEMVNKKVKAIIWAGTSMNEDNLHAFESYIFPEIKFMGLYGNTLMGIAPQRKNQEGDPYLCVYQSFYPFSIIEILDEADKNTVVNYGEKGQVCITLMTPDVFIPRHFERDQAVRIKPVGDSKSHGVADVKPLESLKSTVFEGVY